MLSKNPSLIGVLGCSQKPDVLIYSEVCLWVGDEGTQALRRAKFHGPFLTMLPQPSLDSFRQTVHLSCPPNLAVSDWTVIYSLFTNTRAQRQKVPRDSRRPGKVLEQTVRPPSSTVRLAYALPVPTGRGGTPAVAAFIYLPPHSCTCPQKKWGG